MITRSRRKDISRKCPAHQSDVAADQAHLAPRNHPRAYNQPVFPVPDNGQAAHEFACDRGHEQGHAQDEDRPILCYKRVQECKIHPRADEHEEQGRQHTDKRPERGRDMMPDPDSERDRPAMNAPTMTSSPMAAAPKEMNMR